MTVQNRVPVVEILVREELDARSVPRLTATLRQALDLSPVRLIVDLTGCSRLDAEAIAALLEAHRRLRTSGGRLTLRGPSARLRRNLELTRVDSVLDIVPADGDPAGVPAGERVHG